MDNKLYPFKFDVIAAFAKTRHGVKFIQIGSNDGITGDPIYQFVTTNFWEGVLVEPVCYLFEKLKNNYSRCEDRLFFENSAIAHTHGKHDFYRLKESDSTLPFWYDQLGSFKADIVLKHKPLLPGFDDLFIKETVNTITFDELLKKYSINKVDLIQIDTEGYDFEIIKTIPFKSLRVKLLMYEYKHLSDRDNKNCISFLRQEGFIVGPLLTGRLVKDMIAVRKNLLKIIG